MCVYTELSVSPSSIDGIADFALAVRTSGSSCGEEALAGKFAAIAFAVAFRGCCRSDLRNPSNRKPPTLKIDLKNMPNAVTQLKARPGRPMQGIIGERLSFLRVARPKS